MARAKKIRMRNDRLAQLQILIRAREFIASSLWCFALFLFVALISYLIYDWMWVRKRQPVAQLV